MEHLIICGFAGIGKSTLCRLRPLWIDLESTPFEKDWGMYVKVAKHMNNQGYNVMLSCHAELRKYLHENGVEYKLVLPCADLKDEYITRYNGRGNTPQFVENLKCNWDLFVQHFDWEAPIYLKSGEYLSDVF